MDAGTYPSSRLVLLAQLPSKPSSARVALWRPMRAAGAAAVVNGAWMLPPLLLTRTSSNNHAKTSSRGRDWIRAASLGLVTGIE
jgi:hypothetical protein